MILVYIVLIVSCLLFCAAYLQTMSIVWEEQDIRHMEHMEMHLGQIVRLLEAPDVRALMEQEKSRKRLFLEFSLNLKEDVGTLVRLGVLSPTGLLYVVLFYIGYYLLYAKAQLFCHKNDLRFLAGVTWNAFSSGKG